MTQQRRALFLFVVFAAARLDLGDFSVILPAELRREIPCVNGSAVRKGAIMNLVEPSFSNSNP